MRTLCVTGHRPNKLWGYDFSHPNYARLSQWFREKLTAFGNGEAFTAINGGAQGADLIFGAVCLELRDEGLPIKCVMAVPCEGQEKVWPREGQERYFRVKNRMDEVITLADAYDASVMLKRDVWMVEHSDFVLAVFDGSSGGTGHTVAAAKRLEVPVLALDPKTFREYEILPQPTLLPRRKPKHANCKI